MTMTIKYIHQAKLAYILWPINPSITQIFYRSASILPGHSNTLNDLYFGHRFVDFALFGNAYPLLRKALICHRVHKSLSHSALLKILSKSSVNTY